MQIATERNHRDHVKITQVINQAMQFVGRHSLIEQHLVGLGIDDVSAVKGHQQTVMVLKVELLCQRVQPPCGTARSQNELNARLLRREQLLARTRANHFLIVGERTVDIHRDGFDCHICLHVIEQPCLSHHTEHPPRLRLQRAKSHILSQTWTGRHLGAQSFQPKRRATTCKANDAKRGRPTDLISSRRNKFQN